MSYNADKTYTAAGSSMATQQYHIVWQNAARTCQIASLATNSAILGVLQNKPAAGEGATVRNNGTSKVVAGGAITQAVHITTNGSGRATAVASGGMAIGRATEAAGGDGDIIEVLLYPPIRWAGAV